MTEQDIALVSALLASMTRGAGKAEPCARAEKPPFEEGKAYLIRTATMTDVGEVEGIYPGFLKLRNASWVADTGRFYDALKSGTLQEVEPFPDGCIVALGGIIDAAPWTHPLPLKQK
jgi:hypothetical protein